MAIRIWEYNQWLYEASTLRTTGSELPNMRDAPEVRHEMDNGT